MNREPLTHVAISFRGTVHSLPEPKRHADIVYLIIRQDPDVDYMDIEWEGTFGFLDSSGKFLNRKQASAQALATGQVKDPSRVIHGMLFSEALW